LKSSEDFDAKVNIHVIQCDTKVQSDMVICDIRDVDKLMDGFVVRGFGGTDFRPAFDYVDVLRKRGQLTDLKGMIYFTDGLGQFPERAPDFDAAFVFVEDESASPVPVPPWAMRVVIDEAMVERL
jgi:predicted metal-dependent peptidase